MTAALLAVFAICGIGDLPSVQEMAASRQDVWGEAAIQQPGGPSYEFFKDLLPPLRYVNTAFRHYPIVLSAPGVGVKARWVSNGSAVNARADKKPMWKEAGFPVHFRVGDPGEPFGEDLQRLDGPRYRDGYLPIVKVAYTRRQTVYEQEAFASVRGVWAEHGAVWVRFTTRGSPGTVTAQMDEGPALSAAAGVVRDGTGRAMVQFDPSWQWDGGRKTLTNQLAPGRPAVLMILTHHLQAAVPALPPEEFESERSACVDRWQTLLERGMKLEVPEPIVNDAWRSLIVGNFLIAIGDRMHYSAGNAYDHLYEAECGDATRALMLYGFTGDVRRMVGPLLEFQRQVTRFHVAGHKLQLLAHYYWVTRDAAFMRAKEPVWQPVLDFIVTSRQATNGLLPPDRYAGDIDQNVYALNSNANCWRGLRDMAAVLADLGERDRADHLAREAKAFRQAILDAVAKSERRDVQPPFIPNALFGVEEPYEVLTASRMGSYYDLMAPYIIGSGIFGPGSERETWMIDYLRMHGGLAMGMIRSTPQQGEFAKEPGLNVLYGLRYMLALLRRDDRDHALAGFYGQLAQGMTRGTFLGAEGTRFVHGDRFGRSMYLPPNSASNAMFLTTLRYLLIQDWENDDGRPGELRLLYAIPPRWLSDGATIRIERAPTMFGEISFRVESKLSQGEVLLDLLPPPHQPDRFSVRLPLPRGWKVISAKVGSSVLALNEASVEIPPQSGRFTIRFQVEGTKP